MAGLSDVPIYAGTSYAVEVYCGAGFTVVIVHEAAVYRAVVCEGLDPRVRANESNVVSSSEL